jgi:hypothetical protein
MNPKSLDSLSPRAREVLSLRADTAYSELVVVEHTPDGAAETLLRDVSPHDLFTRPARDADDASCVLAALWLWHDYLDRAHRIVQEIHAPAGSFWHAIVHRREGDFSNSRYWYARAAGHPVLDQFAAAAQEDLRSAGARSLVDLVERVHRDPADSHHAAAVALQKREWRMLFDHCVRGGS